MSTGFRGAYIRGAGSGLLDEYCGVDAGLVSDCLVNNAGHLYDASHPHIVNIVTATGLASAMRQDEPSAYEYRLVNRWLYPMIVAADGGSANVIYRFKGYRSGGSGDSLFGVRIGTARVQPFLPDTHTYQATHTISGTTPSAARGVLYVRPELMADRHPEVTRSGSYTGSGTVGGSGTLREAYLELWCLMNGTKPSIRVSSIMARQFVRLP